MEEWSGGLSFKNQKKKQAFDYFDMKKDKIRWKKLLGYEKIGDFLELWKR